MRDHGNDGGPFGRDTALAQRLDGDVGIAHGGRDFGQHTGPVGDDEAQIGPCRPRAGTRTARTYLRFIVADRAGVLAEITAAMRDADVSIESLSQRGVTAEGAAVVAMVTHECREANVTKALALLEGSDSLKAAPMVMPILEV